jgi:hypothetical protein
MTHKKCGSNEHTFTFYTYPQNLAFDRTRGHCLSNSHFIRMCNSICLLKINLRATAGWTITLDLHIKTICLSSSRNEQPVTQQRDISVFHLICLKMYFFPNTERRESFQAELVCKHT